MFDSDGVDASYKLHVGEVVNTLVGIILSTARSTCT